MRNEKLNRKPHSVKSENVFQNIFSEIPEISLRGNREVVVEGSKGVLHYSEEAVRINTTLGLVCFEGRNLNLKCISPSELIINGFVTKIEFVV